MTPEDFGNVQDGMDQFIDLLKSYRAKLQEAGFSSVVIDQGVIDFHRMLFNGAAGAADV